MRFSLLHSPCTVVKIDRETGLCYFYSARPEGMAKRRYRVRKDDPGVHTDRCRRCPPD